MKHEEFIYRNERGNEIIFSAYSPFFLMNISGIGGLKNNIARADTNIDGCVIQSTSLDPRNIVIQGKLKQSNRDSTRIKLIQALNPKLKGKLIHIVNDDLKDAEYLDCIVEEAPDPRKDFVSTFQISLICPNPNWKKYFEVGEEINTWIGGWKFKFKLPFRFKQKGETKKNIYNKGDIDTPLKIYFKGPAVKPCITNLTTGKFIKINRELKSDDTLIINTERGNKEVIIESNGKKINAFNYIDLDSSFFSLLPGDNLIEYSTESLEPQSVEIRFNHLYIGI